MAELLLNGTSLASALNTTLFQVAYTSVFGAIATCVLIITNNLLSVIVLHSVCNYMGIPDIHKGMVTLSALLFNCAGNQISSIGGWIVLLLALAYHVFSSASNRSLIE